MATINPYIRSINVIFTPSLTTIGESVSIPSTAYLRIQIIPSDNGKNISCIKVWYYDPNSIPSRFNEEIKDSDMLASIAHSMSDRLCHDTLFDQISAYMRTLPSDEVSVIMKEYTKYIEDGILLDGFIAGIASYLVFLILNENSIFMNQMLFQLTVPCMVSNGNTITRNMFQYLSLPLSALSKVSNGVLRQLVIFIQSFINIWEPAFADGTCIGNTNEAKICMEVISGLANDAITKLSRVQSEHNSMMTTLNKVESRLKETIDDSLVKIRREINNLLVETRSSVKDLSHHVVKQLDIVDGRIDDSMSALDDSIKEKIGKMVEDELDDQIKRKIRSGIEETQERIEEIVAHYTMNEGKKIVKEAVNERESQLQRTLIGLEHRIEILYNKLGSGSGEKIISNENNDDPTTRYISSGFEPVDGISPHNFGGANIISEHEPITIDKFETREPQVFYQSQTQGSPQEFTNPTKLQEIQPFTHIISEERAVNTRDMSLPVTPIDDEFIFSENIVLRAKIHGPERSSARETINGKRRIPVIRGQTDFNPTNISEPGSNRSGPWNARRISPQ